MTRWFIQGRVWACDQDEAARLMREKYEARGYTVIAVNCHCTHVPGWWEGCAEITQ